MAFEDVSYETRGRKSTSPMLTVYPNGKIMFNKASEGMISTTRCLAYWEPELRVLKLVPTNDESVGKKVYRRKGTNAGAAFPALRERLGIAEKCYVTPLPQTDGSILAELPRL